MNFDNWIFPEEFMICSDLERLKNEQKERVYRIKNNIHLALYMICQHIPCGKSLRAMHAERINIKYCSDKCRGRRNVAAIKEDTKGLDKKWRAKNRELLLAKERERYHRRKELNK